MAYLFQKHVSSNPKYSHLQFSPERVCDTSDNYTKRGSYDDGTVQMRHHSCVKWIRGDLDTFTTASVVVDGKTLYSVVDQ